jgi:hypothetical protein
MNGYVCFYGGKRIEVYAETSYSAQQKAQFEFQRMFPRKKIRGFEITVGLAEIAGQQVVHVAVD